MKNRITLMLILSALALFVSFTTSGNISNPVPTGPQVDAAISISTDGLMAVALGNPERASIGILRVEHHTPLVTITKSDHGKLSTVAAITGEQLQGAIYFDVAGGKPSIAQYRPGLKDDNDLGHCIDIESDFTQRAIHLKPGGIAAKIHISAGLVYADDLSPEKYRFIAADNSGKMLDFNRQIGAPAIKLNLQTGQIFTVKGDKVDLRLPVEDGIKYQIAVTNLPPKEMASMDHFLFYFDHFAEKLTPYQPFLSVDKVSFSPRPILCSSIILSKSRID